MISPAYAQAAGAAQPGILEMLLPFILIAVVFYFLLIRPQQKRMKEHKNLISGIRRGDSIVTSGGLIGKVVRVIEDKDELEVDLGGDTKVRVVRSTVADVRGKGEPANTDDKKS